jgi:hypothetical protein
MADIKQKAETDGIKVTVVTTTEEPQQSIVGILKWAQVNLEDVQWTPMDSPPLNSRFLQDGKSDLTYTYHSSSAWYELEAAPAGITFIPMDYENDPEGAQRFLDVYPWTGFGYASDGLPSSEGVPMARGISPYVTRADTDAELIYRTVKWLDENYDRFKDGGPWAATMTMENLLDIGTHNYEPLHDGSVRYLEEKGMWTPELEAKRQNNIKLMQLWVDAYQDAINEADAKDINILPDNEEWVKFWEDYRAEKDLPLLVYFQEPGKANPGFATYYDFWETLKPQY